MWYYRQVCDLATEDLLSHLPSVIDFISPAGAAGATLVHSQHGRSRAAAVVMAHLMKKYKYSVDRSLEILRSKRKCVSPNSGFMAQLRLWEAMRFKLEQNFLRYKMYKLQTVSEHLRRSKIMSKELLKSTLEPDPGRRGRGTRQCWMIYKCKSCRRVLATCDNLIPHQAGHSPSWWREGREVKEMSCTKTVSITPMSWMEATLHSGLAGPLFCPQCRWEPRGHWAAVNVRDIYFNTTLCAT